MPYIKKDLRPRYAEYITNIVTYINGFSEMKDKVNAFAFFVEQFVVTVGKFRNMSLSFKNSLTAEQQEPLIRQSHELYKLFENKPYEEAGNMNYVLSAVWWGVTGAILPDHGPSAGYSFRCVTRGCVEQIIARLPVIAEEREQHLLKCSMADIVTMRGVLNDVISEIYRRLTSGYEDHKICENGDVYNLFTGELK